MSNLYRLKAVNRDDHYDHDKEIIVVGEGLSIFNLWYDLNEHDRYDITIVFLDSMFVVDPKKGYPFKF